MIALPSTSGTTEKQHQSASDEDSLNKREVAIQKIRDWLDDILVGSYSRFRHQMFGNRKQLFPEYFIRNYSRHTMEPHRFI